MTVPAVRGAPADVLVTALAGGGLLPAPALPGLSSLLFGSFDRWVRSGAQWLLSEVATVLGHGAAPLVTTAWFSAPMGAMRTVAGVVVLPMLLLGVTQSVIRQDLGGLVRILVVRLPTAAVVGAASLALVRLGLAVTDALCAVVEAGTGFSAATVLSGLGTSLAARGTAAPGFAGLVIAILVAAAALALWLELVVRSGAIDAAVLFVPLVLAALLWPATASWARRLGETLGALVLAKLVIVSVLAVGTAALVAGGGPSGATRLVAGGAMVLLATAAPFALLRLAPFVEAGAATQLEGLARRGSRGASSLARRLPHAAPEMPDDAGLADVSDQRSWERAAPLAEGEAVSAADFLLADLPAGHDEGDGPAGGPGLGPDGGPDGPAPRDEGRPPAAMGPESPEIGHEDLARPGAGGSDPPAGRGEAAYAGWSDSAGDERPPWPPGPGFGCAAPPGGPGEPAPFASRHAWPRRSAIAGGGAAPQPAQPEALAQPGAPAQPEAPALDDVIDDLAWWGEPHSDLAAEGRDDVHGAQAGEDR